MSNWANASNFLFLRHPVPGSNGVNSLASVVTHNTNGDPQKDTVYVAFNASASMLMILHVRPDGRRSFIKEYCHKKQQFDVAKHIAHAARNRAITVKELHQLTDLVKTKGKP